MFVSNCTGERSFSKLKLILNYLRNTMGQERLSSLALLAIENELLKGIDFNSHLMRKGKLKYFFKFLCRYNCKSSSFIFKLSPSVVIDVNDAAW